MKTENSDNQTARVRRVVLEALFSGPCYGYEFASRGRDGELSEFKFNAGCRGPGFWAMVADLEREGLIASDGKECERMCKGLHPAYYIYRLTDLGKAAIDEREAQEARAR